MKHLRLSVETEDGFEFAAVQHDGPEVPDEAAMEIPGKARFRPCVSGYGDGGRGRLVMPMPTNPPENVVAG